MEANHRSIVPNIPGAPWWAAVLIATTATLVGYGIDAGHKELTHAFTACYIVGCVAAVLAVRQSAVFTAVIQPPLILFCAVPGAYWLFHGGKIDKFKDLLINCGYPLIERFPLMLGTAGGVLLIGLIRWYFGMTHRTKGSTTAATTNDAATAAERPSVISGIIAKLSSFLANAPEDDDAADAQPAHSINRTARTSRSARNSRAAKRPARTRSRHARPSLADQQDPQDQQEPTADRPRRQSRRTPTPARDFDTDPPRRSRRPRPPGDPDLRAQPPREMRRDPHARHNSYDRPAPRSSRFDSSDMYEQPEPPRPSEPYGRRYGPGYEPYEPYEPRRRAAPNGTNSADPTHHPISQVRYRGQPPRDDPRARLRDDPRADGGSRPRPPRRPPAESREYDA